MSPPIRRFALGIVVLVAALGQTSQDFCSSSAACYTPARGPQCPTVRFGWGNCPGSRQACDWCYGPNGVFAYTPRGSQYTLSSGCNQLGSNATWATQDPQVAQWMGTAGGNCTPDGRGGYTCSNVDAGRFKQAANCGSSGTQPTPQPPAPPSQPQPAPPSNASAACSCYTPARSPQCPTVRFGWGDCPGSRQACDWCYGPNGVFAYTPRGSQYTLSSGCNQLGSNATWATQDPQVAQAMTNAGGNCTSDGRGGYNCSNVDPARYQQTANCGSSGCGVSAPGGGTTPPTSPPTSPPISGTLPPTHGIFSAGNTANCPKVQFTYFYINGINTPDGPDSPPKPGQWRGNYASEHDTVQLNLIDNTALLLTAPNQIPRAKGPLQKITVSNEIDTMYGATHNPSGTDPWGGPQWAQQNCTGNLPAWKRGLCNLVDSLNQVRAGNFTGHIAPGDLFECIRQSIDIPGVSGVGIDATTNDATVQQVVNAMLDAYRQELAGSQTKNYFIVVGHSQGNFFVEGVADSLMNSADPNGQQIYKERLGIVSLASPTSYQTLDSSFISSKIVHHTRADDAINIISTIHTALGWFGWLGKQPWSPNDPMLWPWPSSGAWDWTFGLVPASGTQAPQSLFGWSQLNCDLKALVCKPLAGTFCRRLAYDSGVSLNPELYSPLMNSHLLDNYLDVAPATQSGLSLKWDPSLVPWKISPRTTAVLNCIRHDLLQLKTNLMTGSTTPATSSCSSGAAN